jgi:hypothetical protein
MKLYPVGLLVLAIILGCNSPASAQEIRIDFATVFTLVGNIFNPSYRAVQATADAEIAKERARQAAAIEQLKIELQASRNVDRSAPVVKKWGVERISCAPGAVFINGVIAHTFCIKPNDRISAGYYTYDAARQQLVRTSANTATSNTVQSSDGKAPRNANHDRGF